MSTLRQWSSNERESAARKLADDIKGRRNGQYQGGPEHQRTFGMVLALTYLLGSPGDVQLAEAFIEDAPEWAALLPEGERPSSDPGGGQAGAGAPCT